MLKRFLLFFVLPTIVIFLAINVYLRTKNPEFFVYDQMTGVKRINPEKEVVVLPEELQEKKDSSYYTYNYVARGYFDSFDQREQVLTIRTEILNREQYRKTKIKVNENSLFAYWPRILYDQVNKKSIPTHTLTFLVNDENHILEIRQEEITASINFNILNSNDYLLVQLENPIDINQANLAKKIILLR